MMAATRAYVRRDWLVWSSYRFNAFLQLAGVLVLVAVVVLIGGSFDAATTAPDSVDYTAFVLAGLGFTDIFINGLTAPPKALREGQMSGTLEPILLTPIRTWELLLASTAFMFVISVIRTTLVIAVSVGILGYWRSPNVLGALFIFVPAYLTFLGLGLIAGAFVLVIKQGDPIVVGYVAVSGILGGALIPLEELPGWLRPLGETLPLTHGLRGLRRALEGMPWSELVGPGVVLWASAILVFPTSLFIGHRGILHARKEGSLVHY